VAINPPSDIVLGAVLAADPSKYRAAADRLRRAGGDTGGVVATPAATLRASTRQWTAVASGAASANAHGQPASPARAAVAGQARKQPDAFAQLEAFVLQSFIQTMLPKNSQNFFGKGTAGEVWKSMLAEKLGAQIASSNQLGLAKRLAAGRSEALAGPLPAAALGAAPRTSVSLMSILPYIQSSAPANDALAGESTSVAERS
jgi:Rod binding domain-containing protein